MYSFSKNSQTNSARNFATKPVWSRWSISFCDRKPIGQTRTFNFQGVNFSKRYFYVQSLCVSKVLPLWNPLLHILSIKLFTLPSLPPTPLSLSLSSSVWVCVSVRVCQVLSGCALVRVCVLCKFQISVVCHVAMIIRHIQPEATGGSRHNITFLLLSILKRFDCAAGRLPRIQPGPFISRVATHMLSLLTCVQFAHVWFCKKSVLYYGPYFDFES